MLIMSPAQKGRTGRLPAVVLIIVLMFVEEGLLTTTETHGPKFLVEPLQLIEFSNDIGGSAHCAATGYPPPRILWITNNGKEVTHVPGLRHVLPNGTLHFPPFPPESYRQDIHDALYQCTASNVIGSILSASVDISAVVKKPYEAQVYDEFVILGNTGVFKCHIPSFVKDYVTVTSWIKDSNTRITSTAKVGGRYSTFSNGVLHIRDVRASDAYSSYQCVTTNRLTGESKTSNLVGRLILKEHQASITPRITDSTHVVTAKEGEFVELPCAAQGFPVPEYKWFKNFNGTYIPVIVGNHIQQLSGSLIIDRVIPADAGKFLCSVTSDIGETERETTLVITAPLGVTISPESQTVDVGAKAAFNCSVTGYPVTNITWLKNGVVNQKWFISSSKFVLTVQNISKDDQGMYQCFAENSIGSVQASSELKLGYAVPELVETFSKKLLQPGLSVYLKCVAKGTPKPQISWCLDKAPVIQTGRVTVADFVNLNGGIVSFVNISSVRVEDGGVYECLAQSVAGTATYSNRIDVYGLPFVRPLKNITVVAKETMRTHCHVIGYPIDFIHWEKDSQRLPFNHRQKVYNNGTLEIGNLDEKEDEGTYTCVARNNQSQSARAHFYVDVKVPPLIGRFEFDKNLHEGMRTRVYCNIAQGDQPITIYWTKDGYPISTDLGISVRVIDNFSVALVINKLEPTHNGNYTCFATNEAATVQYTAQLVVNVPPYWMIEPTNKYVILNEHGNLDCFAMGYPTPQITWKRDKVGSGTDYKQILSGPDYQIFENGTLRIARTKLQDRGHYLCQANNGIGPGLSKVVHVTVHVPAHFEMKEKTVTVIRGEKAMLLCEAIGDKPMAIVWKQNDHLLNPMAKERYALNEKLTRNGLVSEITITDVQRSDTGSFVCLVTNAFGQDYMKLQLIVQEPPSSPQEIRVLETRSRSTTIQWDTPYDGNSPLLFYIIMLKNESGQGNEHLSNITVKATENKIVITGLHPSFTYNIYVLSQNALGSSEPSNTINITTEEEVPGGPPTLVKAKALNASSVKVSWEPPPKNVQNGKIKGYYIGYKVHNSTELYHYKNLEVHSEGTTDCILSKLQKFTRYSVLVQAYNSMGAGPRSDEVSVLTEEDVPDQPPHSVTCSTLSSQTLHVEWRTPPVKSINGVLVGFRVIYRPIIKWAENLESHKVEIEDLFINLVGLEMFTNYSIQVAAYTRIGNGVFSGPVYCRTHEGVPGEPENIKVFIMGQNAILVSWKPPLKPNGEILKYTVYMSTEYEERKNISKIVVPSNQLTFEARNLIRGQCYKFWVTASTSKGEGNSSQVIEHIPDNKAPAKIASFGSHFVVQQQQDIELACRAVGLPTPSRKWKFRGKLVNQSKRVEILPTGTLRIEKVQPEDSGNYSCSVWNMNGFDEIIYFVNVEMNRKLPFLPPPPVLYIDSTTTKSVTVTWRNINLKENPIIGYTLYYKKNGNWLHDNIPGNTTRFTVSGLDCGSHYEIYMVSFNKVGQSEAGNILPVGTKGGGQLV
ncbi:Down syndrome cell adhesion molecule-like protein Dscam2 [Limulus polyphemus]|uniref:Down syndrome cell adhesion molecule-like protein Dscam2 n=1 Tax=Limulus polyphemus TaxID=6850 RepID=A0ABM1SB34_LIMPO|nr:Down syndrome cell adhesion molecule-like protein Dscam2 [Limulus polyphemus]